MKKLAALLAMLASFTFFSSSALAVEVEGTVDEVRVCLSNSQYWSHYTFVKFSDGQWISFSTNYGVNGDYDDNASFSLIMTAYASRYKVKVKATGHQTTLCGITSAAGFHNTKDDYVALTEYSQAQ